MLPITNLIKKKAKELGFTKIGIIKAEEFFEESVRLKVWLSKGYQGEMDWLFNGFEKRINPLKVMPDAKSIIVTAINYFHDFQNSNDAQRGKISRYAWGNDYHEIIEEKLKLLLEYIKIISPDSHGKYFVDTGPVMEKALAKKAGIGWQGKNSLILTRDYGSWIFLGVIYLDKELDYDHPEIDYCGTCTRCIDVCPTSAIVEPYIVDSRLCISYLTIEYKGDASLLNIENNEKWIYGCDACQDVCPWNIKFAKVTDISDYFPREINKNPKISDLELISEDEFNKNYESSSIKRIKVKKFLNNIRWVK